VVLADAGSAEPVARADVDKQARLLTSLRDGPVVAAFLTGAGRSVAEAADRVRAAGRPPAVAAYLLGRGLFQRLTLAAGERARARAVTAPLAPHDRLADLVLARYDERAGQLPGWREGRTTHAAHSNW
jgi:sirohydrochlorin ferrochelatase